MPGITREADSVPFTRYNVPFSRESLANFRSFAIDATVNAKNAEEIYREILLANMLTHTWRRIERKCNAWMHQYQYQYHPANGIVPLSPLSFSLSLASAEGVRPHGNCTRIVVARENFAGTCRRGCIARVYAPRSSASQQCERSRRNNSTAEWTTVSDRKYPGRCDSAKNLSSAMI